MGARNRTPRQPATEPTLSEALMLHVDASMQLKKLLEEIAALRDAGKRNQARKLMKDADELRARLEALGQHLRRKPPQRART